jgi:hypothetical protein
MATEAEMRALLNSIEEGVRVARRAPDRAGHRDKGSIIDPEADAQELSEDAMETFRRCLGLPPKLTLDA